MRVNNGDIVVSYNARNLGCQSPENSSNALGVMDSALPICLTESS